MRNIPGRAFLKFNMVVWLAAFFVLLVSALFVKAQGSVVAANTDGIEEIIAIGNDSFVYVYDYNGQQVYKSPESGWNLVTTADLNNDGDKEIIAVGGNVIKVFDPQIVGSPYSFSATYGSAGGTFTRVASGNFITNDSTHEIALLRSVGNGRGRIVIYDPPNVSPVRDVEFLTDWRDFAVGDYDGDGDDDFALIYWNSSNPSGLRNWMELRKGSDPNAKLEDSNNAGQYSDSEWFDIATGDFVTTNGSKREWVGSQNLDKNVLAQRWSNQSIVEIWSRTDGAFQYLATADFRGEGNDQVVMLRNVSSGVSLRYVNKDGLKWADLSGLGTGWLNVAAGNVDTESTFEEAVILRGNLIRVYRLAQSTADNMNCDAAGECLDISGSFRGALALGDLGTNFEQPTNYAVSITEIGRSVEQGQSIAPAQFSITGETPSNQPLTWGAIILPELEGSNLKEALQANPNLSLTITDNRLRVGSPDGGQDLPEVDWMSLSDDTGTTPTTVTVTFSDTNVGSPLYDPGLYQATILVWQDDIPEDRFRFIDVTVLVSKEKYYIPLLRK